MTTRLSIILAATIAVLIALDQFLLDGTASLFLAKKGLNLISFIAFWR